MTRTAKRWLPPVAVDAAISLNGRRSLRRRRLFGRRDALFLSLLADATAYAEFGMGASTVWVANHTRLPMVSVDTHPGWVSAVAADLDRTTDVHLLHVDVGPLGQWGTPVDYSGRAGFLPYVEAPFTTDVRPDLVLVDGRFRVACLLTTLLRTPAGTNVVVDDYVDRPHYHVVEDVVPRHADNGRQAHFVVPDGLDTAAVTSLRDQFLHVLD
jgi:hypothetical protein